MIPKLDYFAPTTLGEALNLLSSISNSRILAGGTDVLTGFHQGSSRFKDVPALIDINRIEEITGIVETDDSLIIGAAANFTSIINNAAAVKYFPSFVAASATVGSVQIRNRATIGGNFVNNAPCADGVPSLLVYDAVIKISSSTATREMPLGEFLIKPYKTQLMPNEIVTHVILKKYPESYKGSFYKLGRRRGVAISRIALALLGEVKDSIITDIRVATGAITPIGKRVPEVEAFLLNKKVEDATLREAASVLGQHILDATGVRWSTPYKLPVAQHVCYSELSNLFSKEA